MQHRPKRKATEEAKSTSTAAIGATAEGIARVETSTSEIATTTTTTATFTSTFTSTSESTSRSKSRTAGVRIASLIYLPPFCCTCKQEHAPAAASSEELLNDTQSRALANAASGHRHVVGSNSKGNNQQTNHHYYASCCCQRRWEHKNYDKHATAPALTSTRTAKTTTTRTAAATTTIAAAAAITTTMSSTMRQQQLKLKNRITPNASRAGDGVSPLAYEQPQQHELARNFLQQIITQLPRTGPTSASASASVSDSAGATHSLTLTCNGQGSGCLSHPSNKSSSKGSRSCSDLRQQTSQGAQLVMPIVVGEEGAGVEKEATAETEVGVLAGHMEFQALLAAFSARRYQRRERARRERKRECERERECASHASTMPNNALAASATNPISNEGTATTTALATAKTTMAAKTQTTNDSQTTTTTAAAATTTMAIANEALLRLNEDECRCFNYNGDISAWTRLEDEQQQEQQKQQQQATPQQLPRRSSSSSSSSDDGGGGHSIGVRNGDGTESSITWLKLWQQLVLWLHAMSQLLKLQEKEQQHYHQLNHNHSAVAYAQGTTKGASVAAAVAAAMSARPLRMTSPKSWLGCLLMLLLTTSVSCWGGRQDVPTNCTFPARWEGSWFLSGYQQSIHIKGSQFSYRGRCAASDGNKYLIVDEKGCHRCLVIYEKHKNVLQYKESECEGDSMYMHQSNPSALAMRSSIKQSDHRGGAHPNTNGHSRLSSSDQYIMRSNDDMNDYFCKGRETLQNLCDQIPGDALLYSLFRESAEPVKCPLKGPFIFTYNRGHGECKSPVSNIESCTEESRLLLSFQACPDVQGTESTVEELTCLATWKDGNSRYLVGLVSHHHAISNEERYRCFVYEKISSLMGGPSMLSSKDAEYKLAQSGDATCNGLDSAEVGSRIMSLRKPPVAERCDFPAWFKGPRHWHALMGNAVYNYHSNDGSVHIIKPNGYMETRALCEQINKQTATEMMAVVHYTTGCQSGFMCMMFYRRDTHVIEIQTGKPAIRLEDACAPDHFDINKMAYITLLANNPDPQICPMEGLYNLRGAIGPPYLATRHKRNHNGKAHLGHGHHHHESGDASASFSHKGHSTLSFRNAERIEKGSWHANTRGLPARSRRAALLVDNSGISDNTNGKQALLLSTSNETSVGFVATRSRRDVPGCVTNYKAQRQLWVGCTEPNVIDVRPLCNEDGEEEYSCHGSWSENATIYIIARHKGTKHGVCISYKPTEGTAAKLVVGDACYRGTQKPPDHHLMANLSVFGKCGETSSGVSGQTAFINLLVFSLTFWLMALCS